MVATEGARAIRLLRAPSAQLRAINSLSSLAHGQGLTTRAAQTLARGAATEAQHQSSRLAARRLLHQSHTANGSSKVQQQAQATITRNTVRARKKQRLTWPITMWVVRVLSHERGLSSSRARGLRPSPGTLKR